MADKQFQWRVSEARDPNGEFLILDDEGLVASVVDADEANVIAAAPDLLEALKDARFALYGAGTGPGNPKIDAAIAKAEGAS